MMHPDYQYTPKLIPAMASIIANGLHPCVLGSRILGGYALRGGMPFWKYVSNRFLTLAENILLGAKLSEYHTGYRAFSREILETLPLAENSDDFVFDNQMLAQILWHGFTIGEVSCPTKYFPEASSINFRRSIKYGFGCLGTALAFRLAKMGLWRSKRFTRRGLSARDSRDFLRLAAERCSTPNLTALSQAELTPGSSLTASLFLPVASSVR